MPTNLSTTSTHPLLSDSQNKKINPTKNRQLVFRRQEFHQLLGKSKQNIIDEIGLVYNDIHTNRWMYYLDDTISIFKKNFLYLYFKKNKVVYYKLKRYKDVDKYSEIGKL